MSDLVKPGAFDLRSHTLPDAKREELLRLFPEIATEGGKIDFDRLRLVLGETVDVGRERYGMNWPGKADCFKTIQAPSLATLRPAPEESVNFDTTENLIIEGDNLEVLKLLQKSYLGKVKLIYIDPPYNTGNDFIYPDNYAESLQTYLEYTGQVDAQGRKFGSNPETDGRFHSRWLNMMYPRLYLARNLLRDDGVLFVSVDDREVDNLKKLCSDIFGEDAFAGQIAVVNNLKGRNDRKYLATAHEYLLMYVRPEFESLGLPLSDKQVAEYKQADESGQRFQWRDLRKRGGADTRADRPRLFFPIYVDPNTMACAMEPSDPFTIEVWPRKSDNSDGCWRWGPAKVRGSIGSLRASQVEGKDRWNISYRVYLEADGEERVAKPKSIWIGPEFSTDAAVKALKALIPDVDDLTPKPVALLRTIMHQSMEEDGLCLDFFAGSGTCGQAVLEQNLADGGARKFILVQLPEPTGREDFPTIAELTKERVRRVITKLNEEDAGKLALEVGQKQDRGFRVFKLAESNFTPWDAEAPKEAGALADQLEMHVRHIRQGRTDQDILYEILLKDGFPPTTQIAQIQLAGKKVFSAAGGAFLISLEREITLELIRALAEQKPERVVLLDEGFAGNDQLKANAVKLFEHRGVTRFRTV